MSAATPPDAIGARRPGGRRAGRRAWAAPAVMLGWLAVALGDVLAAVDPRANPLVVGPATSVAHALVLGGLAAVVLGALRPAISAVGRPARRAPAGRWAKPTGGLIDLFTAAATILAVTWLPLQRLVPLGVGRLDWVLQITVLAISVLAAARHLVSAGRPDHAGRITDIPRGLRPRAPSPSGELALAPPGCSARPARLTAARIGGSALALSCVVMATTLALARPPAAGDTLVVVSASLLAAAGVLGRLARLAGRAAGVADALAAKEAYLEDLFARSSDAILVLDREGTVVDAVSSVFELTGLERHEIVGRNAASLLHPDDLEKCRLALRRVLSETEAVTVDEFHVLRADGWIRWLKVTMTNRLSAPVAGIVAAFHDITARKRAEAELARRALHDGLTGLPNRALFADRLHHSLQRRDVRQAVMYLDLDRFKVVNDSLGHAAGDRLLAVVAARLAAAVRDGDTVARLGGDEFAVLIETAAADDHFRTTVADLARRILVSVGRSVDVGGTAVVPGTSIGVAFADTTDSADDVLRHADLALYAAKARGRNQMAVFDAAMQSAASLRLQLENDLRAVLRSGSAELGVGFQPIVELRSGRLRAFEALARWEHPSLGPIGPDQFIPIAEESGLIVEVGARVLGTACRVAATCNGRRPPGAPIAVSVNVAAAQLVDPGFLATVRQALTRSGLAPERLNLEVTEDALVRYPEPARTCLGQLRQLGVGVSIDDFGTGRSSLGCLHRFPIDTVKIDQSFFEPGEDGELAPIVRGLLELMTTMGLTAVAEGIESAEQVERLVRAGCPLGQGHLFAPALEPTSAIAYAGWQAPAGRRSRKRRRAA